MNAQATFVNGLVISGDTLDTTGLPGANTGRLGMFSDLYYDSIRDEWWALSDRGQAAGCSTTTRACSDSEYRCIRTRAAYTISRSRHDQLTDPNGHLVGQIANVMETEALNGSIQNC